MARGKRSLAARRVLCAALLVAAAGPVAAQGGQATEASSYRAGIYVWSADMNGETRSGLPVDISFSELADNLDAAFMGMFEARIARWSIMADLVYMDVSAGNAGSIGPLTVSADIEMTGWVVNLNAARSVYEGAHADVNVLFGARYLDLVNELSATGGPLSGSVEAGEKGWDGVVGLRGTITLPRRWFVTYYVDAGAGESDFTWQGFVGGGYQWKWVEVALGYRYLAWQFKTGDDFDDMALSGPLLGAAVKF